MIEAEFHMRACRLRSTPDDTNSVPCGSDGSSPLAYRTSRSGDTLGRMDHRKQGGRPFAYEAIDGTTRYHTRQGCHLRCSACSHPRDERERFLVGISPLRAPPLSHAHVRSPCLHEGALAPAQGRTGRFLNGHPSNSAARYCGLRGTFSAHRPDSPARDQFVGLWSFYHRSRTHKHRPMPSPNLPLSHRGNNT